MEEVFLYGKEELLNNITPANLGGGTITDVENNKFSLEEIPYRFEGGTQNISGIIGLGKAIGYLNNIGISKIENYSKKLTKELYENLSEINDIILYGNPKNILNIPSFNIKKY